MKAFGRALGLLAACFWSGLVLLGAAWADQGDRNQGVWTIGDFKVNIDHLSSGDHLTISQGRKKVLDHAGQRLWMSPKRLFAEGGDDTAYQVGRDILGIGAPVLVVSELPHNARCCESILIIVLRKKPVLLPLIKGDDLPVQFVEIEGEKSLAVVLGDDTWTSWKTAPTQTPGPKVWLRFDPKAMRYAAASDLMARETPPTTEELDKLSARARKKETWKLDVDAADQMVPPEVLYGLTQLVYTGHFNESRRFVERSWMGTPQQMEDFWREAMACRIRRSPYWPALAELNHLPADPPQGDCGTLVRGG